jgi:hypothetical protein
LAAELVERAGHGAHRPCRHLGVEGGGVQLDVAEQRLNDANVDAVLQQVRGEAVPQRMRPNPLGDVRCARRLDDDPVQLPGADRLAGMLAWKQPALGVHHALLPADLPPLTQQGEHILREHRVAILPAFATFDPEQHALAIDVADLEGRDLGDAQARAISDRQRRLVLEAGRRVQQAGNLVGAQHRRQLAWVHHSDQPAREVGPVERVREKEP